MGKTLGIDRDLARKIKRMSRKELDGYLTRVTDKSYNNGYEQGLAEGIALTGQGLEAVRCLVTMYTKDIDVIKGEEALRNSKYDVFNTHIRHSKKVTAWTYENGQSLLETTPRSAATRDYKNLVLEYMGKRV